MSSQPLSVVTPPNSMALRAPSLAQATIVAETPCDDDRQQSDGEGASSPLRDMSLSGRTGNRIDERPCNSRNKETQSDLGCDSVNRCESEIILASFIGRLHRSGQLDSFLRRGGSVR